MSFYLSFADAHPVITVAAFLVVLGAAALGAVYAISGATLSNLPRAYSFAVLFVPTLAVVAAGAMTGWSVDELRADRVVAAVEAKYDVSVSVAPADPQLERNSDVWVIDGDARTCMASIDDIHRPDPVLVCDGVELGH